MTASRFGWTFALTSLAWFVFALDRLVVTTALPVISADLDADLAGTEWVVSAYTLTFAVLLLTGAALGDRFGRRRMFTAGIALFALGSVAAALAPTVAVLVVARIVQGAGGAVFAPLAMTLLSAATRPERRGAVLGAWGGIGGLGAAAGPLLGGGVTVWAGWPWIFWLNVPLGVGLVVLAPRYLVESRGPHRRIDVPGVAVGQRGPARAGVGAGRGGRRRVGRLRTCWPRSRFGALASVAFVVWELRAPAPMLPMRFFRRRAFVAANVMALLMYAALFGSLFLLTQLLQTGLDATPWEAGLRMLPMVVMPMLLAPVGGVLADRWGTRPLMIARRRTGRGWARRDRLGRRAGGCLRRAGPGDGGDGRGLGVVLRPRGRHRAGRGGADRAGTGLRRRDRGARAGASSSGSPCWPRSSPGTAT